MFPRGARGHAVVMIDDPFSDLPFFLVVKNPYDLRSQIRFWILPKKTLPKSYCAFHKHANSEVQKPPSQLRFSLRSVIIAITSNDL